MYQSYMLYIADAKFVFCRKKMAAYLNYLKAAGKNRRIFTIYLTGSLCALPAM